ncbi:endonuclease/exonuclease/phosphatase family protein [Mesobacillus harenae]|uniref:endonuclease/exonuclease/phosphatase family protein n=1 Tax=Mesobacillus harenae TaxID=2213203 RepID=UPI001580A0C8|nr:endonuclease/exonuclease/phosphatase family protein [Mesobacillus harenae]
MGTKVMTYNIHHGKGLDKQVNLDRICKVIDRSNADIIGLNEVDFNFSERSRYAHQIQTLADKLKYDYAFSPSVTIKAQNGQIRQYGNGILSRFPIGTIKSHPFNFVSGMIEGRSMLEASIEINGKQADFFVTHLSLNPFLHKKQSNSIIEIANKKQGPLVLMGDWNMKPSTWKWNRIASHFTDVWSKTGKADGATFPARRPVMRLDYQFVNKQVEVIDCMVFAEIPEASDHLPVLSTLVI